MTECDEPKILGLQKPEVLKLLIWYEGTINGPWDLELHSFAGSAYNYGRIDGHDL